MLRDGGHGARRAARLRGRATVALVATVGALAAGAALLGAFDGPDEAVAATAPATPIVGHVFRSVAVVQDGRPMPLFEGTPVWLAIERRSFGAYADCNHIGGPLRLTASRLIVSQIEQTAMGCMPAERQQRDGFLASFLGGDPAWRTHDDRLVLVGGRTTITLERDDLPPPLARPNPARPRALIDAVLSRAEYQTWPRGIGDSGGGPDVDIAVRGGRTYLTMRGRCRLLEAPVRIHRSTLSVSAPRRKTVPCRPSGSDYVLTAVRSLFGGTVQWHLDHRRLTLQRDRTTLTLRVR
jgi:heat shock protein HslJ